MGDRILTAKILFSCIPGFEKICQTEIADVLKCDTIREGRGRVVATVTQEDLKELLNLRSVHNYWVIASEEEGSWIQGNEKLDILERMEGLAATVSWETAFDLWRKFKHASELYEVQGQARHETDEIRYDDTCFEKKNFKFRATTSRLGSHCFTSPDVSRYVGSGVKEKVGWEVDLENYDINVQVFVDGPKLILALQLTKESQHKRNLSVFGPTTLMPSISFCILKLAQPEPGDVVCDPMCGGGSISLEGAHSFAHTFQLGGEMHPEGCARSQANFVNYPQAHNELRRDNKSLPYNIVQWDACNIPIRSGCVDIIVCDLPFGKKMGHRTNNWSLYTCALREAARVCRINKGRAVILTQHKEAFNRALKLCHGFWTKKHIYHISMGGLNVGVYVLFRTSVMPQDNSSKRMK